ncbi:MAG TPA: CHAD domain-containing protein, partial [Thermoleophilaceae bacterium]|nr:CHAD domain-containing protein [Thermoleophilaceae bacterium]
GVLDTADIERVHDMRVATRRLRAALELYEACFPKRAFREALRDVKALADALGARRDPDVQLAATEVPGIESSRAAADRPGLDSFAAALRERQTRGNEVLAQGLRTARESGLAQRLVDLAATAGPG